MSSYSQKCAQCHEVFSAKLKACPSCGAARGAPERHDSAPVAAYQEPQRIKARQCVAHGCPLAGTFSPIIYGESNNWQCFIHSELPMHDWQSATHAIRQHMGDVEQMFAAHRRFNAKGHKQDYDEVNAKRRILRDLVTASLRPLERTPGED